MGRRRMTVQDDLFALDGPTIPMSMEHKKTLIGLISALIVEVMTVPEPSSEGGNHVPDHD